jgi:lipid-binding SYLF domain-containing protein
VLKGNKDYDDGGDRGTPSFFSPREQQGDANISYVGPSSSSSTQQHYYDDTLLYGRGLEQRVLAARHPQRTCQSCHAQLMPLQEELCLRNSNAMRYNYIDEGDAIRRMLNSPLAFTLGHEVRKAAYALGNLLPGDGSGRFGSGGMRSGFVPSSSNYYGSSFEYSPYPTANTTSSSWKGDDYYQNNNREDNEDKCHIPNAVADSCKTFDPTFRNVDGGMLHIPSKLLNRAKGVAIVTCCKGGLGFAGFEFGTGLVVARRKEGEIEGGSASSLDNWSAPSAIGIAGFAWGALLGAQVSDHVFLLMTDDAVRLFASEKGGKSIQLGADVGVAVGPVGRSVEADFGAGGGGSGVGQHPAGEGGGFVMAPIFTYSLSRGLYAGASLDGRILMTRDRVNEKFYGRAVSPRELLSGQVPIPPAAQPLYDALKRCRVYGSEGGEGRRLDEHNDVRGGGNRILDEYHGFGIVGSSSDSGGFMERWRHTTGAGLPVSPSPTGRYSTSANSNNPYDLSGRTQFDPVFY